jgi:hypothetical protein
MLTIKAPSLCTGSYRRQGVTLIELVMCSALFLAFMAISWGLFSGMFKNYQKGEERVRPLLQLRHALYFVNSKLKGAVEVCTSPSMQAALTSDAGSDYIIFNIYGPDLDLETVGFVTEMQGGENALLYKRFATTTGTPSTWPPPEVAGFRKTVVYPLSTVKFQMLRNDIIFVVHLGTKVALKDTHESVDLAHNIDARQAIDLKTMVFRRPMGSD